MKNNDDTIIVILLLLILVVSGIAIKEDNTSKTKIKTLENSLKVYQSEK